MSDETFDAFLANEGLREAYEDQAIKELIEEGMVTNEVFVALVEEIESAPSVIASEGIHLAEIVG